MSAAISSAPIIKAAAARAHSPMASLTHLTRRLQLMLRQRSKINDLKQRHLNHFAFLLF